MWCSKPFAVFFLLVLISICSAQDPISRVGLRGPLSHAAVPFRCKRRCLPRRQFRRCPRPAECFPTRCRLHGKRFGLRCARARPACLLEAGGTEEKFGFTCTCPKKNVRKVTISLDNVDIVCIIDCLAAAPGVEKA